MKKKQSREQKIGETKDILDATGQENEKQGIKWTRYFMDKFEKEEWVKDQLKKENLEKNQMTKKRYYDVLAKMLHEVIVEFERPAPGYVASAYPTEKGVVAQFKDRWGRTWAKAFKPSGIPKIDYHAVKMFAGLAEDKMYSLEESKQTSKGIYLL